MLLLLLLSEALIQRSRWNLRSALHVQPLFQRSAPAPCHLPSAFNLSPSTLFL